jgi:hypothetical protein
MFVWLCTNENVHISCGRTRINRVNVGLNSTAPTCRRAETCAHEQMRILIYNKPNRRVCVHTVHTLRWRAVKKHICAHHRVWANSGLHKPGGTGALLGEYPPTHSIDDHHLASSGWCTQPTLIVSAYVFVFNGYNCIQMQVVVSLGSPGRAHFCCH